MNRHRKFYKPSPEHSPQSGFCGEMKGCALDNDYIGRTAMPVVQGIPLVSTCDLPDRFRSLFPFQIFNAVQSRCFRSVYHHNDNLVLSAPTGCGKTTIFELAICKLVGQSRTEQSKIIYVAPTKSLCSERQRDWEGKFKSLGLICAELTGDTDYVQQARVQGADLIITTPEKWDSVTRGLKDHSKLMQLVRLFLVDEVHILKESRGATLEAVVSRVKSSSLDARFIALSATVPNPQDIATWFGRNRSESSLPAQLEVFGENFRPVKLQRHVVGIKFQGNDFAFDQICDEKYCLVPPRLTIFDFSRLPDLISKYSAGRPIIIFCSTRKSAETTAKSLSKIKKNLRSRLWPCSSAAAMLQNSDLGGKTLHTRRYLSLNIIETFAAGVAFHHAGLAADDRCLVEKAFLERHVGVICCTSTLAVGVNLPCYLVVIKNTVSWQAGGLKEYSELEVIQMLGRAGRYLGSHFASCNYLPC